MQKKRLSYGEPSVKLPYDKKSLQNTTRANFFENASGATAIEYAFICAFIVLAVIVGITALGSSSRNQFTNVSDQVSNSIK